MMMMCPKCGKEMRNGYLFSSKMCIRDRYKHYTSKQEILDRIVEHMNEMDYERAESYEKMCIRDSSYRNGIIGT